MDSPWLPGSCRPLSLSDSSSTPTAPSTTRLHPGTRSATSTTESLFWRRWWVTCASRRVGVQPRWRLSVRAACAAIRVRISFCIESVSCRGWTVGTRGMPGSLRIQPAIQLAWAVVALCLVSTSWSTVLIWSVEWCHLRLSLPGCSDIRLTATNLF